MRVFKNITGKAQGSRFTRHTIYRCGGFTLIEVMISLLIIAVALVSVAALLTSTIVANRKARAESEVFQNVAFTLEDMSRKIREGTDHIISAGGTYIDFVVQGGDPYDTEDHIIYRLNQANSSIERKRGNEDFLLMTAPNVTVTTLSITKLAYGGTVDDQPRFLITLAGVASTTEKTVSQFNLQTQVAKRRQPPAVVSVEGSSFVPENPLCTFNTAVPNRYIVDMEHGKENWTFLCGIECGTPRQTLGPYSVGASPIPAGWYSVKLVTYDNHCTNGNCSVGITYGNQAHEQFFVRMRNAAGTTIASSGNTSDIPNTENTIYPHEEVNTGLYFPSPVYTIQAVHAVYDAPSPSSANSVVPVCAAFDWLGSTTTVDIAPF